MSLARYLAPEPVIVSVGGIGYTVPPVDAAGWLAAVSGDLRRSVIPGMLSAGDRAELVERVMVGEVTNDDLWSATCAAIQEASGRSKWWQAVRLVGYAEGSDGSLFGRLLLAGVRPQGLTFAAWCACLFTLITQNMDEKQRMKFDASFLMPPDGDITNVDDWDTGIPEGWG